MKELSWDKLLNRAKCHAAVVGADPGMRDRLGKHGIEAEAILNTIEELRPGPEIFTTKAPRPLGNATAADVLAIGIISIYRVTAHLLCRGDSRDEVRSHIAKALQLNANWKFQELNTLIRTFLPQVPSWSELGQ